MIKKSPAGFSRRKTDLPAETPRLLHRTARPIPTSQIMASTPIINLRMTSNDSVEGVVLERTPHEYSYKDSSGYHFLDPSTYEDAVVYEDLIEGVKNYLIEGQLYNLMVADGVVVAVDLPLSMVMTVAESSEGVKGDSANNVYKPAVMETGLIVQVPLFINVGEKINVKTEDNSYTGRSN
jgi:elongation factor P